MADDYSMILRDGEYYLNDRTGRTHKRKPAGGAGGGVTSYADVPASDEEHLAFLRMTAEQKAAESEQMQQRHDDARDEIEQRKADGEGVNNPIGPETYGRPPQAVPTTNQTGPKNPADERDYVDNKPTNEAPAQGDPNQPKEPGKQPDPNQPFYKPDPQPAA